MKKFYSHLVEYETLIIELDQLDLSDSERKHLAELVDSNLHQAVIDTVLSELDEEHKKIFLEHLHEGSHDKIWNLLEKKVDKIEDKIKQAAEEIKSEMKKDIKESKVKSRN